MPNFEIKYNDDEGKLATVVVRAAHKYEAKDHVKEACGGVVQMRQVGEGVAVDVDLTAEAGDGSGDQGADSASGQAGEDGPALAGAGGDDSGTPPAGAPGAG